MQRTVLIKIALTLWLINFQTGAQVFPTVELNNRPIVGVLLQEQVDNVTQYVTASYVKWLEAAGARVAPIFVQRDLSYYNRLLGQINGVLMPGGGTPLLETGYSKAADLIFDLAIRKFHQGIYFPVWATCLSFEKLITYYLGNTLDWETRCNVQDVSLNLEFPPELSLDDVRMLRNATPIAELLTKYNVTANYHRVCLTVDTFKKSKHLTENFTIVSTNTYDGHYFVSTLEHKRYPIYATQWHPEKNQFEWVIKKGVGAINHDFNAIQVGQYFGNFFVNEARRNRQRFANATEEADALIYNFNHKLVYSAKASRSSVVEKYIFKVEDDEVKRWYERPIVWIGIVAALVVLVVSIWWGYRRFRRVDDQSNLVM